MGQVRHGGATTTHATPRRPAAFRMSRKSFLLRTAQSRPSCQAQRRAGPSPSEKVEPRAAIAMLQAQNQEANSRKLTLGASMRCWMMMEADRPADPATSLPTNRIFTLATERDDSRSRKRAQLFNELLVLSN